MLKFLRRVLFLGLLAAAVYALWRKLGGSAGTERSDFGLPAQPAPFPTPPIAAPPEPVASDAWVEPAAGACPVSHPVKGKLTSGIFHVPGGQNYERTRADRCYTDAGTAEADGLRQAKR
jgi:hypothetical protein